MQGTRKKKKQYEKNKKHRERKARVGRGACKHLCTRAVREQGTKEGGRKKKKKGKKEDEDRQTGITENLQDNTSVLSIWLIPKAHLGPKHPILRSFHRCLTCMGLKKIMHPYKCHLLRYSTQKHFSPLLSSTDLLIQNSLDSSTHSQHNIIYFFREQHSEEEKVQVKKQKIRTIFSQTLLYVFMRDFRDRNISVLKTCKNFPTS